MPNTHSTLTSLFTDIADAIRDKKGTSESIVADDFPTEIASIPTGTAEANVVDYTPSVDTRAIQVGYQLNRVPFLFGFYAVDSVDIPSSGYYALRGFSIDATKMSLANNRPAKANSYGLRKTDGDYSYITDNSVTIDTINSTVTFTLGTNGRFEAGVMYRFIIF